MFSNQFPVSNMEGCMTIIIYDLLTEHRTVSAFPASTLEQFTQLYARVIITPSLHMDNIIRLYSLEQYKLLTLRHNNIYLKSNIKCI